MTNFKNPVNMNRKNGFKLTTLDSQGFLIDTTSDNLQLITPMTELGQLTDAPDIITLGDAEGKNVGRIQEYNSIQLFFDSYIPFEQNCYFKF